MPLARHCFQILGPENKPETPQASHRSPSLLSLCHPIGGLTQSLVLNAIQMPLAPEFISPAQTFHYYRLVYTDCSRTSPLVYLIGISNETCPKTKSSSFFSLYAALSMLMVISFSCLRKQNQKNTLESHLTPLFLSHPHI